MSTLNPNYVSGLIDGEGSFSISFSLRSKLKVGIETRPSFSVTLNQRDLELVKMIHDFFGCGGIRFSRSDRTYKYEVRSTKDIVEHIIPHFDKYPLNGIKKNDYQLFKKIVLMIHRNMHLNVNYLKEIIDDAYKMNPSGKRKHEKRFLLRTLTR